MSARTRNRLRAYASAGGITFLFQVPICLRQCEGAARCGLSLAKAVIWPVCWVLYLAGFTGFVNYLSGHQARPVCRRSVTTMLAKAKISPRASSTPRMSARPSSADSSRGPSTMRSTLILSTFRASRSPAPACASFTSLRPVIRFIRSTPTIPRLQRRCGASTCTTVFTENIDIVGTPVIDQET